MKKFFIFFALCLILFYSTKTQNQFTLTDYFDGQYTSYSNTAESNSSIDLGFCFANSNKFCSNTIGESIVINNLEIGSAINTLNANVIKSEYLPDGTTVIYAYTPLIHESVSLNNKKVNLQIATRNEISTIGWPLILGSF